MWRAWSGLPPSLRRALGRAVLLAGVVVALVNGAVNFVGGANVFLLSPFHLRSRVRALGLYALHRPGCAFRAHPPLTPLITAAERRHGLPPGLLEAVVEVESGGRPHAISGTGAVGPGQLLPSTARLLEVRDPFDSEQGVDGSARYLAAQLHRFGSIRRALAAYNAGPGAVGAGGPWPDETRAYVEQVTERYARRRRVHAQRRPAG
ncbi:MAG: lytic transglycosylase domain-containing protein [Myxococcaceae bacterium]